MKFIYEHDEEEDFIEVQLSEHELKRLMHDTPVECSVPACLNTRRLTNVYVRRMNDAVEEREQSESYIVKHKERNRSGKTPKASRGNSNV